MIDRLDTARRSRLMQKVGTKDTGPEMTVRSILHRMGYRFRLHRKDLPGTPDIVFPRRRVALFVHGCFWHMHGCQKGRLPKSRLDYWEPKLLANRQRDERNVADLRAEGWNVAVVWQCELGDRESLEARLRTLLGEPSPATKLSRENNHVSRLRPRVETNVE